MRDQRLNILFIFPDPESLWQGAAQTAAGRLPGHEVHCAYMLDDAVAYVSDADVIVSFSLRPDLALMARNLKWVHALGAGVDRITSIAELRPDVIITNTRGMHADPVSEAALSMMFALSRDFRRAERDQRAKRWVPWNSLLLSGKTIGIVGVGVISEALAGKCRALGMRTLGLSGRTGAVAGFERIYAPADQRKMLGLCDYVVLLAPLKSTNVGMVDRCFLDAMKPTAFLINVARGPLVDSAALTVALRDGRIGGAGLDANDPEPLPATSPLWEMNNVIITPHVAGRFDGYLDRALDIFGINLRWFIRNDHARMVNRVDRSTGMISNPWHDVHSDAHLS